MYQTIKNNLRGVTAAIAIAASFLPGAGNAAGLLTPAGSNDSLEIRSHDVEVTIQDGYVITEVDQVFSNPHQQDLEAIYAFPIPEQALVSAFTMWIDGQPVVGEVLEKKQAKIIYQEEKKAGRQVGLTEQNSYKRFEIRVSPVRASSDTRVRLQYMQSADIDTGIGRYVYPLEEGGTDDQKLAFWTANETVNERFSFNVNLRSAHQVDAVRLPNQPDARVIQNSKGEWQVDIVRNGSAAQSGYVDDDNVHTGIINDDQIDTQHSEQAHTQAATSVANNFNPAVASELDNDIVMYWRLAESTPASLDLVAYKTPGASTGTFMMVVSPGDDLAPINQGRDWMFVVDISGSMEGKFHTLVDGIQRALKKMHGDDRFRIVTFNKEAMEITSGWITATPENVKYYAEQVSNIIPNGGTNLYAGVEKGLRGLDADRTTGLVLVTDGVANIGETTNKHFLRLLKRYDARLFTFIMGNEANRPLLQAMADHSRGFAINISNNDDIVGKLLEATQKINHQAMHNVRLDISGVSTSDITPSHLGTVYRGEQMIVMGKYHHAGEVFVNLKAEISGQPMNYSTRFNLPDVDQENPELERLWAFSKIQGLLEMENLLGRDGDRQQAITDIAIDNGIVTENTSMIVMREEQFVARNIQRRNKQRVKVEAAAQKQRKAQPVKQRAVDKNSGSSKPMFKMKRPSFSGGGGGGAFDPSWLLVLMPLVIATFRKKRKQG